MSMIYNFIGTTKGKTSSALGTVLRALGSGKKVRVIFFMKHWNTSETEFLKTISELKNTPFDIQFYKAGDKDFIYAGKDIHTVTLNKAQDMLKFGKIQEKDIEDVQKAHLGLHQAWEYLDEDPFLIVLDEINVAIEFGLVEEELVLRFLDKAKEKNVHVVITGRISTKQINEKCDLVTEMNKIKHPFDKGEYAVKGLDY